MSRKARDLLLNILSVKHDKHFILFCQEKLIPLPLITRNYFLFKISKIKKPTINPYISNVLRKSVRKLWICAFAFLKKHLFQSISILLIFERHELKRFRLHKEKTVLFRKAPLNVGEFKNIAISKKLCI